MSTKIEATDLRPLAGHWKHSHEEDRPGRMVFRPASGSFPYSRGREEIQLRQDGSCIFRDIAMGNGLRDIPCRIRETGRKLHLIADYGGSRYRTFEIVHVTAGKLVLKENIQAPN